MIWGVFHGHVYETRWTLAPGLDLVLNADALSVLFVTLSTVLWLLTTVYAIGYLENAPHRSRFFGFFSLCVTATVGLALAGNLFTFVIFYEALTLATYPLVAHRGTPESIRGARIYLAYTIGGGTLLLLGAIWLRTLAGPLDFAQGGILGDMPGGHARSAALDLPVVDRRARGQGGPGSAAWLAATGDGRTGAGQRAAARRGRGEGGCLRHRARGLRRLRGGVCACARTARRTRCGGSGDHRLRLAASLDPGQPEEAARLLHRESGVLHRPRGGHPGAAGHHRRGGASGPSGTDEDHAVLRRRQLRGDPGRAQRQRDERRGPSACPAPRSPSPSGRWA